MDQRDSPCRSAPALLLCCFEFGFCSTGGSPGHPAPALTIALSGSVGISLTLRTTPLVSARAASVVAGSCWEPPAGSLGWRHLYLTGQQRSSPGQGTSPALQARPRPGREKQGCAAGTPGRLAVLPGGGRRCQNIPTSHHVAVGAGHSTNPLLNPEALWPVQHYCPGSPAGRRSCHSANPHCWTPGPSVRPRALCPLPRGTDFPDERPHTPFGSGDRTVLPTHSQGPQLSGPCTSTHTPGPGSMPAQGLTHGASSEGSLSRPPQG